MKRWEDKFVFCENLGRSARNAGMISSVLNIFGLLFDIGGVVVLFKFGLSNVVTLDGSVFLLGGPSSKEEETSNKKEGRFYYRMSSLGLTLILIGFLFQLAANILSLGGGNSLLPDYRSPASPHAAKSPASIEQAPKP